MRRASSRSYMLRRWTLICCRLAAAPVCWRPESRHHCLVRLYVGPLYELYAVGNGLEHLIKRLTNGLGLARQVDD